MEETKLVEDEVQEELTEDEEAFLTPEQRECRRLELKPDLSHLERATERKGGETLALFDVNRRLVVERRSTLASGILQENWDKTRDIPWLDTRTVIVRIVDHETGAITAWDEEGDKKSHLNFKNPNQAFYFAPPFPKNPFKDKRKKKQSKKLRDLRERMNNS